MNPDLSHRTVKIPAEWRDGRWQVFGGGDLPQFDEGAVIDLVFPAFYLHDRDDIERWTQEQTVPFLPKGTELLLRISPERIPRHLLDQTIEVPDNAGVLRRFVLVVLDEDQGMSLVPGKNGTLLECPCTIPNMRESAISVNEAYKKIAATFEPDRHSNQGNIFLLAYVERDGRLVKLDTLRDELPERARERAVRQARQEAFARMSEATGQMHLFEQQD